jgi:hypothetical protein
MYHLYLILKGDQMKLTKLEKSVYEYIRDNADEDCMECVDIDDLVKSLNESAKVLRGVLSSLVKKDKIWVEEYDSNFVKQYFYWIVS